MPKPAFKANSTDLQDGLTISCAILVDNLFLEHEPLSIPPRLARLYQSTFARLYQSTFGGHPYRTIAGMVLLASLLCLLFLSPAWLALLPLWGKTLGSMAFGLQNIFPSALAKTLLATFGGFLALTAPKWLGNLFQFVGIRLLGGVVGRVISISMCLVFYGIDIAGMLVGLVPLVLLEQYYSESASRRAKHYYNSFVNYSAFSLASLPGLPLLIIWSLGAIMNTIGIVISGEYQHIQEKPSNNNHISGSGNKPNSSVWNKILLALKDPIPAVETLKHDPAIIDPINRLSWAIKYDRFCHFFRPNSELTVCLGNLCYAKDREKFKNNWVPIQDTN